MVNSQVSSYVYVLICSLNTVFSKYTGNDTYRALAEGSVRHIASLVGRHSDMLDVLKMTSLGSLTLFPDSLLKESTHPQVNLLITTL